MAFEAWQDRTIPEECFPQVLRALVCSFEIDDYFRSVTADKYLFFRNFLDNFLQSSDPVEINFQKKCEEICQRISPVPNCVGETFIKIAHETLLLCLCGISSYYIASDSTSPLHGLERTEKLIEYINRLSKVKKKRPKNGTFLPENPGLGLNGWANWFRGRFLFSLGRFNESEKAFDMSTSNYFEKIFWKIASIRESDAESRSLSLRRANLSQILGKARIYFRQSRLGEGLEILENIRPLLSFATGKVMSRYSDVIYVSTKRAKYSSDPVKLLECKQLAEECFEDFTRYTPDSYFVHRCNVEISLINSHLKNFARSEEEKIDLLKESLSRLDLTIKYSERRTQTRPHKNIRLLVEALTHRSYIRMGFPGSNKAAYLKNIDLAIDDAQEACELGKGMKQLECDAHLALGLAYQRKPLIDEEFIENKQKAANCFFEALSVNNNENPRVAVISYLRLAELEMGHQPNYVLAKFYFERFERYKNQVEHQYVIELGAKLERQLSEKRVPDFYVDTSKSLNFKDWAEELKENLIKHTILRKANEIEGVMPAKRRRNERSISQNSTSINTNTRKTRQSILAEAFKKEIGLAQNEAFSLAGKHLKEFENICNSICLTKKNKEFYNRKNTRFGR